MILKRARCLGHDPLPVRQGSLKALQASMKTVMKVLSWLMALPITTVIALLRAIYFLPNFDLYTVRSDSMRPAISAGDAIFTVAPGYLGTKLAAGSYPHILPAR